MLKTQLDNTSLLLEASRGGGVLSIIRDYSTLGPSRAIEWNDHGWDGSRAGWSRAGWFGRVSFSVLPVFVRVAASFSTLFINVSIKLKHGIIIPLITTIIQQ